MADRCAIRQDHRESGCRAEWKFASQAFGCYQRSEGVDLCAEYQVREPVAEPHACRESLVDRGSARV